MLRRLSLAAAAFAVGALLIASGASADKPIKEAGTADPFVFDGPTSVCDFPVQVTFTAFKNFSITHLGKDGEPRWIGGAGRIVQQLTNLDNNKSVTLDSSGPGKITFDESGVTVESGPEPGSSGITSTTHPLTSSFCIGDTSSFTAHQTEPSPW